MPLKSQSRVSIWRWLACPVPHQVGILWTPGSRAAPLLVFCILRESWDSHLLRCACKHLPLTLLCPDLYTLSPK